MVKSITDKQVVVVESEKDNLRFKGVRKRKWGKFVSEIRLPNSRERIWLGSYDTPEKAARAFDAALFCLRGKQAKFNFPDNPPDIAGATSLKPQEIQVVAAKFANEYSSSPSSPSQQQQHNHFKNVDSSSSPLSNSDFDSTPDLTAMDWPYLDFSMMTGSESSTPDFGTFDELDYFAGNLLAPEPDVGSSYDDDEINGQDYSQTSFLWNF